MITSQSPSSAVIAEARNALERFWSRLDALRLPPSHRPEIEIETDVATVVTEGRDRGAWVEAWVWVPFAGAEDADGVSIRRTPHREWDPGTVPIFRFRVGKLIHRHEQHLSFTTRTIRELLIENEDNPGFVRELVGALRQGRIYDGSDGRMRETVLYVSLRPGHEVDYASFDAVSSTRLAPSSELSSGTRD